LSERGAIDDCFGPHITRRHHPSSLGCASRKASGGYLPFRA
jgi:hypothetical protein